MQSLDVGIKGEEVSMLVSYQHLACTLGSGDTAVFATPMLVLLMEQVTLFDVAEKRCVDRTVDCRLRLHV